MSRDLLYLDTARLGLLSERTRSAANALNRLNSDTGCSLYFSDFLRYGSDALPSSFDEERSRLSTWQGVKHLKGKLKDLAGANKKSEVLLASRSAVLMRFALRILCRFCRKILTTDLSWPSYEKIVVQERRHAKCDLSKASIREEVLSGSLDKNAVVHRLTEHYISQGCDGIFLPVVDNRGIVLPVREIVAAIRRRAEIRFVVLDGAQALNHVPLNLAAGYCDILISGCHKWVRSSTPLGVAFFGMPGSVDLIQSSARRWMSSGEVDDPLLAFTEELESDSQNAYGETVSTTPLILANSAVSEALISPKHPATERTILDSISALAVESGWLESPVSASLRGLIQLLRREKYCLHTIHPASLKRIFLDKGVALTAYPDGYIRISLPSEQYFEHHRQWLKSAFLAV